MSMRITLPALVLLAGGCILRQPAEPVSSPAVVAAAPAVAPAPRPRFVPVSPDTCELVRDGNKIARVQSDADVLMERVRADPAFGWARYEHWPCYRFILAFTGGRPRPWVVEAASPELRPYLAFAEARRSSAERQQVKDAVVHALKQTGVRAAFAMNNTDDPIELFVRTEAEARAVLSAIPASHRSGVRVVLGPLPMPTPERFTGSK